jgi:hypothetical protein
MMKRLMALMVIGPMVRIVLGMIWGVVTIELLTPTWMRFWRMKLTPIAVMSGARRGAFRRGL